MDLKTLSRESKAALQETDPTPRAGPRAQDVPPPRRRWLTRFALPLVIVLAVLAVLGYAMRDVILPAREVSVVRATAVTRSSQPASAADAKTPPAGPTSVVAQAPGWVEPDPYPVYVTALADGVVQRVNVLEGEPVEAGQVLIEMVREDAELSLSQARAELSRREAALSAARTDYNEPIELERAAAVAGAKLAESEAALNRLDAEVAKEQARLAELEAAYDRVRELDQATVSPQAIDAAKYQAQSQRAVVEAIRQRRPELESRVDAARANRKAAERDLELKTELLRQRDEAKASVAAGRVGVEEAELRLKRMTIRSPIDGVVMARLASPGDKLRLGTSGEHTAHPIHLYDPQSLQVRVDVPLADAAAVGVGQDAIIIVDVLPDTEFRGRVTRLVHKADIAKNTVQFKVRIDDPSPLLKPDMLARVKFLGRAVGGNSGRRPVAAGGGDVPVAIRSTAIVQGRAQDPFVWWVSPTHNRIEQRPITLGAELGGGDIEVLVGLNPGDVVVDRPGPSLQAGQRVRVRARLGDQ